MQFSMAGILACSIEKANSMRKHLQTPYPSLTLAPREWHDPGAPGAPGAPGVPGALAVQTDSPLHDTNINLTPASLKRQYLDLSPFSTGQVVGHAWLPFSTPNEVVLAPL